MSEWTMAPTRQVIQNGPAYRNLVQLELVFFQIIKLFIIKLWMNHRNPEVTIYEICIARLSSHHVIPLDSKI